MVLHAALSTAVAPPCGIQTVNLPRGSPHPGRIVSSASIPVATGSAVRCVTGVASGNLCSMRARMAELRSDIALQNSPNISRKQEWDLGREATRPQRADTTRGRDDSLISAASSVLKLSRSSIDYEPISGQFKPMRFPPSSKMGVQTCLSNASAVP